VTKEGNVGRPKMALSEDPYVLFEVVKNYMLSVLSACKWLVNFCPETGLNFLFVEYCKVF